MVFIVVWGAIQKYSIEQEYSFTGDDIYYSIKIHQRPQEQNTELRTTDNLVSRCIPKFQGGGQGSGITASAEYASRCTSQQTKERCDVVDVYRASTKNFGNSDGIPDCTWVVSDR
ncbi:MAG: hypothetical protein A3A29_01105 [Candidatus Ryanbacteria bacterium RIFCSPLOWO2_01_FULL_47_79]|nr:MAG: hypothetical protein A2844_01530 [Candidatus Ryanbacteria bacterium RIFCSPHIGHO2_01_FULL_48_80]OGZ52917.1 MAG: hypothetical protein A3A29_01105 [Candidatus Ryanbacteria bacterium RIFCSPLOWO2_01_FULL_47_79]